MAHSSAGRPGRRPVGGWTTHRKNAPLPYFHTSRDTTPPPAALRPPVALGLRPDAFQPSRSRPRASQHGGGRRPGLNGRTGPLLPQWTSGRAGGSRRRRARGGRRPDRVGDARRSVNQGERGTEFGHSLSLGFLGQTYLQLRRIEPALERARLALDLSRAQRERGHEAYATKLLGEIASYPESPDDKVAQSYYCQVITLAKESECAGSSRRVTSAAGSSAGALASASRPKNTSPAPRRCTARWPRRTGWRRRRRRWQSSRDRLLLRPASCC
jgi:hypothetical protein